MNTFDVLKGPHLTEKSLMIKEEGNHFVFKVHPDSNKYQIRHAVQTAFTVDVLKVRTMNVRGKKKRMGRFAGQRPDWKKAIGTLKQGQTIEYFEGA